MRKSNIIDYKNPSQNLVTDVLSEFLRESAQKMLQLAIEEEVQNFISSYQDKLLTNGSKQVVRNGYLPERNIQTGIGEVAVKGFCRICKWSESKISKSQILGVMMPSTF